MSTESQFKAQELPSSNKLSRLQDFKQGIATHSTELMNAKNGKEVSTSLISLQGYLGSFKTEFSSEGFYNLLADVFGSTNSVLTGDYTRKQLSELMQHLISEIDTAILKEQKRQHVLEVRAILLECAEHAEQIVDLLNSFEK